MTTTEVEREFNNCEVEPRSIDIPMGIEGEDEVIWLADNNYLVATIMFYVDGVTAQAKGTISCAHACPRLILTPTIDIGYLLQKPFLYHT